MNKQEDPDEESFAYHAAKQHVDDIPETGGRHTVDTDTSDARDSTVEFASDIESDDVVSWEASEYIHHQKDTSWYVIAGVISVVAALVAHLLVNEAFPLTALVVLAAGAALVAFAARKPHTLRYTLSSEGLIVGDRHFSLQEFRSFSVLQEGAILSVRLFPTQRFMPLLSLYCPKDNVEQIVGILNEHLAFEDREPDLVDRIVQKIRF